MKYKIINGAVSFGADTILEEINFEINNKEKIAIIGRNGCGKSTFLNALINNALIEEGIGEEKFAVYKESLNEIGFLKQVQQVSTPVEIVQPEPNPEKVTQTSENIETLIAQSTRMAVTAGNDEQFEINKECWGGFGELFGKKVVFCLMDTQKTMGNLLLTQSDNYKISFYLSNKNEPAVVINCKKLMVQTINGEEAQKMSPSCMKKVHLIPPRTVY